MSKIADPVAYEANKAKALSAVGLAAIVIAIFKDLPAEKAQMIGMLGVLIMLLGWPLTILRLHLRKRR